MSSWSPTEAPSEVAPTDASPFGFGDGNAPAETLQPSTSSSAGGATYMAMPRLYGQPAYARPPRPLIEATPRPFDPDDLPLERFRTDKERDLARAAGEDWERQRDQWRLAREGSAHGPSLEPSSTGGIRAIAARLMRAGS